MRPLRHSLGGGECLPSSEAAWIVVAGEQQGLQDQADRPPKRRLVAMGNGWPATQPTTTRGSLSVAHVPQRVRTRLAACSQCEKPSCCSHRCRTGRRSSGCMIWQPESSAGTATATRSLPDRVPKHVASREGRRRADRASTGEPIAATHRGASMRFSKPGCGDLLTPPSATLPLDGLPRTSLDR